MWHVACGLQLTQICATVYCCDCLACGELYKPVVPGGPGSRPTQRYNLYYYAYAALHKQRTNKQTKRVLNIFAHTAIRRRREATRRDTADAPQSVLETIARFMKAKQEQQRDGERVLVAHEPTRTISERRHT